MKTQVFLGGTCGTSTWRQEIAIPLLEQAGVSFHNPQLAEGEWGEAHQFDDMRAKAEADVQLFVISGETRGVSSVGEAAYILGRNKPVALMVEDIRPDTCIGRRTLDAQECEDLNRGRMLIRALAYSHGVPVFTTVAEATHYAIECVVELNKNATQQLINDVLAKVRYKDLCFVSERVSGGYLIYAQAFAPERETQTIVPMSGRKWFIAEHTQREDIVRTVFKAVLTWEEHEAREFFLYDGQRLFNPHFDLD